MLNYSQLEALLAVDQAGTIEGAARTLRVSSFAISQRVSQLEKRVGTVLVERGPTRTSEAGKILSNHARQVANMEEELMALHQAGTFLDHPEQSPIHRIAIPEELISGWFRNVLNDCLDPADESRIDITISNPHRSIDLMQSGNVVAGISTAKNPIHGFKSYSLGKTTYLAVASSSFIEEHFASGITADALGKATCLRYCHNDGLASAWAKQLYAKPPVLPLHKFPDPQGALKSVLSGKAWSMIEAGAATPHLKDGNLVELVPGTVLDQPLYWHVAVAMLDTLTNLTKAVRQCSR